MARPQDMCIFTRFPARDPGDGVVQAYRVDLITAFSQSVSRLLRDFYRCPRLNADFSLAADLLPGPGYFRTKDGPICYGRLSEAKPVATATATLPEVRPRFDETGKTIGLTFDPGEVFENLLLEKYTANGTSSGNASSLIRRVYYLLRPLMPVGVRKHLQRLSLRGWNRIPFPLWPVDRSVDHLYEWLLALAMEAEGVTEVPFVWFWPEGYSSCACLTHDVETSAGRDFCGQLMDLDDSYGIKGSFQLVPEKRYEVPTTLLNSIRERGFEVHIHDLNHDGHLFSNHEQFLERAQKINSHGKTFEARGFRSAVLYRRQEWMNELDFAYDMSVPNVAHLDPQRGGCCTLMPYFIGDLLEIPVTVTQDYSLFHILRDYSTNLWEEQITAITHAHGMASFIIHPDYVIERRARQTYERLLMYLADLRTNHDMWIARPGEINDWWRARAKMELVQNDGTWRVTGKGSELARVAYVRIENNKIFYRLDSSASCSAAKR